MAAKTTPLTVMGVQGAPFRPPFGSFASRIHSVIYVSSTVGMLVGDTIQIMLDNNELFTTTITAIPAAGQIGLARGLPSKASAGNIVLDLSQSKNVPPDNEDFLT